MQNMKFRVEYSTKNRVKLLPFQSLDYTKKFGLVLRCVL